MNIRITLLRRLVLFAIVLGPLTAIRAQVATLEATVALKEVDAVKIPYQNGFALPSFEKQNRQIIDLKGTWKKQRFTASDAITLSKRDATGYQNLLNEAANRHLPSYDDAAWQTKTIRKICQANVLLG
ncbi:MAG: hypothetical protein HYV28_16810 [Ignavibacteriales bacterium]|nr:hypothetical protein [Ignavibacteriales bacterium]